MSDLKIFLKKLEKGYIMVIDALWRLMNCWCEGKMINYLILILSTLLATGKALFCKALGTGNYTKKENAVLNFKSFLVASICALAFVIDKTEQLINISSFSLMLSVIFGFTVALTQIMQSRAMGRGPSSVVTLIYSCGFLIPIFYGLVFWEEKVSLYQWMGIALLTVALGLIVAKKEKGGALLAWMPFAVVAMLGSGANAIFQKTHQRSPSAEELPFFLVCSLFFAALFTGIASLILREKKGSERSIEKKRRGMREIVTPLCLGVCVGALNFLNLSLSGKIPSVLHFPIYNVGSMLLTVILSALIYKDKLAKRQTVGFVLGMIAIWMIGVL